MKDHKANRMVWE